MTLTEALLLAWAVIATVVALEYRKAAVRMFGAIFAILDDKKTYEAALKQHNELMRAKGVQR